MDTTAHQATMHSSSHKENDVSEGARTDFRPDHQTTLRNNVAASDFRGQTENNKSESVKSGPISSRTRSKKAAQAISVPGCATLPAPLLPLWAPKRIAPPSTPQRSSSFPRPTRSHAHRCSCLTR